MKIFKAFLLNILIKNSDNSSLKFSLFISPIPTNEGLFHKRCHAFFMASRYELLFVVVISIWMNEGISDDDKGPKVN